MILSIIVFTVHVCEINLSCGYLKRSSDMAFQFSVWLSESPFYWKSDYFLKSTGKVILSPAPVIMVLKC